MNDKQERFFNAGLAERDPLIHQALCDELTRQSTQIELIASENTVSRACMQTLGSVITNKTVEGYPGARFHGGAEFADIVENTAIDRAKTLFACTYANVQTHSGTQANQAVLFALLKQGEPVLSMDLVAGGHLSHGSRANLSGQNYAVTHYGVDRTSQLIDYDAVQRLANECRPKILIAGGSSYPRAIDFARLGEIAKSVGAYFLVDMAHFAGLVAAGAHASPLEHADVVTCTTTKTLRGPRGGLILSNDEALGERIQSAVFPGVQGSIHLHSIAAKAVCLGEALQDDFKIYGHNVLRNARVLAQALADASIRVVAGGTDTHLVLIDVSSMGLLGRTSQQMLEAAGITTNSNPVPFDAKQPAQWVGLRLGSAAVTTRGFDETQMQIVATFIAEVLAATGQADAPRAVANVRNRVAALCAEFPIYRKQLVEQAMAS